MNSLIKLLGGYTEKELTEMVADTKESTWKKERAAEIANLEQRRKDLSAILQAVHKHKPVLAIGQPILESITNQLLKLEEG